MEVIELNELQLQQVSGGTSWRTIGYHVGRGLGWYYNNVLIGSPWP